MNILLPLLRGDIRLKQISPGQWNLLLSQARNANVMARLGSVIDREADRKEIPAAARQVIEGTEAYVSYLQLRLRHEIRRIEAIAESCDFPVVLLKGAAYILSRNAASAGRGLSDIDVLVPRDSLAEFESRLRRDGWRFTEELSSYDEHYYRELSHELPPMRRPNGQLELDVHHNLLQPTHRFAFDASSFFSRAREIPGSPLKSLAPIDQILHSVAHLMLSDELRGGLRDVHDVKLLCEEGLKSDAEFGAALLERADTLGLVRPLYYVLDYAQRELGLSLTPADHEMLHKAAPGPPVKYLMSGLVHTRLNPSAESSWQKTWAERLLYLRSHWIRMPPLMLMQHLSRKTLQRLQLKAA